MSELSSDMVVSQAADAISRVIQGETVLLTPEDSTVHVLDDVGSRIWEMCSAPISIGTLAAELAAEYDVDEPRVLDDVRQFLGQLFQLGVIDAQKQTG